MMIETLREEVQDEYPEQMDGCSFEKKGSTSAYINSSHSCRYCRYVHYVVVVCPRKLYLQLVFHCITGDLPHILAFLLISWPF